MEWVETTGKSLTEAQDLALDQLGVAADEAEFEVLEEPKSGLFGRVRGEARVRARVKPTAVRPKQDRRSRGRDRKGGDKKPSGGRNGGRSKQRDDRSGDDQDAGAATAKSGGSTRSSEGSDDAERGSDGRSDGAKDRSNRQRGGSKQSKEQRVDRDDRQSDVSPQEVGDAAVTFMGGLAEAFGVSDADTSLEVDGTDLDVRVSGTDVGLMVGPGGRTLTAVQDLARVAAQRRLGDHDTRLRIDVGGYREKRNEALAKFATTVAHQVIDSGEAKALEPMASNDRKVVHDTIVEIEGVTSHSEGDEPRRRVVITPE